MALLSNINIRSHSLYVFHSSRHPFYHFYESFVLPYFAFLFPPLVSQPKEPVAFFFLSRYALVLLSHTRFFLFIVSYPRSVSLPQRRRLTERSLHPLFLFRRRRWTRRIDENLTSDHHALTGSRLENAWRYFCARTASSMYFHISAVGLILSRSPQTLLFLPPLMTVARRSYVCTSTHAWVRDKWAILAALEDSPSNAENFN